MKKPLLSTSVEIFEVAVVRDKILNPEYFNSYAASHLAETKPYWYILEYYSCRFTKPFGFSNIILSTVKIENVRNEHRSA